MRTRIVIATLVAISAIVATSALLYWSPQKMTKVHTLKSPLLLSGDGPSKNMHMLPKGTVLYFDQSYSEGFTRYKVYINIDRMPLELRELSDPTQIIPIEAEAPAKADLQKLLNDYPLSKTDLESILKSGKISKEEIKEILREFSR